MSLFFVSNLESMYYQSQAFGKVISYMSKYPKQCKLREQAGKRSLVVADVDSVGGALVVLQGITDTDTN